MVIKFGLGLQNTPRLNEDKGAILMGEMKSEK
jgi:hypothetical protein